MDIGFCCGVEWTFVHFARLRASSSSLDKVPIQPQVKRFEGVIVGSSRVIELLTVICGSCNNSGVKRDSGGPHP